MNCRSFELNYENNILFHDLDQTAEALLRQDTCLAQSNPIQPRHYPYA